MRLWDGTSVPLGRHPDPALEVSISAPGVLGSLLRRPSTENLLRRYAAGQLAFHGAPILAFGDALREQLHGFRPGAGSWLRAARHALPLLVTSAPRATLPRAYAGDARGTRQRRDSDFVSFHYDVPTAFFELFLGPTLQYSCAWFERGDETLEQAQVAKLERICQSLALARGERFLDVGCGWGELVCHAALHHSVRAHGVTLSREQVAAGRERIKKLGIEDLASIEHADFASLAEGAWDKIACVEMYEHVGLENLPAHFRRVRRLLRDGGRFLHQGSAGRPRRRRRRSRDTRLTQRYLLPGAELPDFGTTIDAIDRAGLEIRSVENWRLHYARTTEHWCARLESELEAAAEQVGAERARLCLVLLAGFHWAFARGRAQLYQLTAVPR